MVMKSYSVQTSDSSINSKSRTLGGKICCFFCDVIPARYVITMMAFFGVVNMITLRGSLNIAIVAMTKEHPQNITTAVCPYITNSTKNHSLQNKEEFDWDERSRGLILGSFFWGYLATLIIGGRLTEIFGAKWTYGIGVLGTAVLSFLIPIASRAGIAYILVLRIIQGAFEGVTTPGVYSLMAKWCPPMERSYLFVIVTRGIAVGTILAAAISGQLMKVPLDNGWPFIFYFFGLCGVLWFILMSFLIYESPYVHPRISPEEKQYIISALQSVVDAKAAKGVALPWKAILTSIPVWALLLGKFGYYWGVNVFFTGMPTYLKTVLHYDMHDSASLASLPYVGDLVMGIATGIIIDRLRSKNILSTTAARKICTLGGGLIPAALCIAIAQVGCDRYSAVTFIILTATFDSLSDSGVLINDIDISPRFAGTLVGLSGTVGQIPGILAPYLTGFLTNGNSSVESWSKVFYIACGIKLFTSLVYGFFGTGDVQSWNSSAEEEESEESNKNSYAADNIAYCSEYDSKRN